MALLWGWEGLVVESYFPNLYPFERRTHKSVCTYLSLSLLVRFKLFVSEMWNTSLPSFLSDQFQWRWLAVHKTVTCLECGGYTYCKTPVSMIVSGLICYVFGRWSTVIMWVLVTTPQLKMSAVLYLRQGCNLSFIWRIEYILSNLTALTLWVQKEFSENFQVKGLVVWL